MDTDIDGYRYRYIDIRVGREMNIRMDSYTNNKETDKNLLIKTLMCHTSV